MWYPKKKNVFYFTSLVVTFPVQHLRELTTTNIWFMQVYLPKTDENSVKNTILSARVCKKEGNVLFNDTLNTFYLVTWHQTYGSYHQIAREETRCCHMGYSFQLAARVLLYASFQTG